MTTYCTGHCCCDHAHERGCSCCQCVGHAFDFTSTSTAGYPSCTRCGFTYIQQPVTVTVHNTVVEHR